MPRFDRRDSKSTLTLSSLFLISLAFAACNGSDGSSNSATLNPGGTASSSPVGERPRIREHLGQADLASGLLNAQEIIERGRRIFNSSFNTLDGAGRPGTTGDGQPRPVETSPRNFNRISGPEANSCSDCHAFPFVGGSGGNSNNVFVLAENLPAVNFDESAGDNFKEHFLNNVGLERNTPGLMGTGFIELLAREMTAQLLEIEAEALQTATSVSFTAETRTLIAKEVNFGSLTAFPDGTVDKSLVSGVDADLIVKPFHQKGVVSSIRQFTNTALNRHHGMQTSERFGVDQDPDGDGVLNELTAGDVTALTLFQATLPAPGRVIPTDGAGGKSAAVIEGAFRFESLGCAECHIPELRLNSTIFTEPGPFNPPGNLQPDQSMTLVSVDLLTAGPGPFLEAEPDGTVRVPAYTDLKRHNMGPLLNNEQIEQGGVPTNVFITKRLWGMSSEPPFMHHGRALTIREAIIMHAGDAELPRNAFEKLSIEQQNQLLEFLTTLRTRAPGAPDRITLIPGPGVIGEEPVTTDHIAQGDIDADLIGIEEIRLRGAHLFDASHNSLDGAGRPETAGDGTPRVRRKVPENFNRISGPDSNSCVECHIVPRGAGGGSIAHNVHVLSEGYPFLNFDGQEGDDFLDLHLDSVGNERSSIGLHGSGFIELVAREMSFEIQALRDQAMAQAQSLGIPVSIPLRTKGVQFGNIIANPDGSVFTGDVFGVDADLVVKPFRQKGTVVSLRDFTNFATNRHHGMQSSERFGVGLDPDQDGVVDELTIGDMTAFAVYQSLLPVPGRRLPSDPLRMAAVDEGEIVFSALGCVACHVPELLLENPIFTEPGPFNPPGNLTPGDVPQTLSYDLTTNGRSPRLVRETDGTVLVPAYTDLKRHDMGLDLAEAFPEAGVPRAFFLTKKLWGMSNEPPYMHHGRALTLTEAILMHGGEAQASREAFAALEDRQRDSLIDFLNTLQTLPGGSDLVIFD